MSELLQVQRVLIANRGEIARRLIREFKSLGIETVSVFSEPDQGQPWVEEADYSAYLNGRTVAETYLDANRVIGVAMDAGCDAVHPGYCFLAGRLDFAELANQANMAIIGSDPRALARVVDRQSVRRVARELGIPLIPASDPISAEQDPVGIGAQLGFPLFVKTMVGDVIRRVDSLDRLAAVANEVRALGALVSGDSTIVLERAVDKLRACGTVVVADRYGSIVHLGETDGSLQYDFHSWVEEVGEALVGSTLHARLGERSVELARGLGWIGVGKVRWAITPDGGAYLLGFTPRLTTGYELAEQVHGIDLINTQFRVHIGERLGWEQADVKLERHGVQLRIFPFRAGATGAVEGEIERLVLPTGEHLAVEAGTAEGQPCTEDTDPLLVKITVTGPTRHAALVRARAALEELVIEGVETNREFLLEILAEPSVWRGQYNTHTLEEWIASERNRAS